MQGKALTFLGILLFFSVVMGSFIHEVYHVFEYGIHGERPKEICIVGYGDSDSTIAGAFGWVDNKEKKEIGAFKIPFAFNEIIPYTLQIITTTWCFLGLLYAFRRRK